jgi:integrase
MTVYRPAGRKTFRYDFEYAGRRHSGSTGRTNRRDALAFEAEEKRKLRDKAEGRIGEEITVGESLDRYINAGKRAPRFKATLESIAKRLMGEIEGKAKIVSRDLPMSQLRTADVLRIGATRAKEGQAVSTSFAEMAMLRSAFRLSQREGYHVASGVEFKAPRGAAKTRYLSEDEEVKLLAWLDPIAWVARRERMQSKRNPLLFRQVQDNYDLVVTLLDTGFRYGEAQKLLWTNVDFTRNSIRARRWKTSTDANVVMTDRLRVVMERRWREKRGVHDLYVFSGVEIGTARSYAVTVIAKAMEDLGFNAKHLVETAGRCTVHSLRHTYASRLVQRGMSLKKVQDLLGHTSPLMTQRYAVLEHSEVAQEAAAILNATAQKVPPHTPPTADVVVSGLLSGAEDEKRGDKGLGHVFEGPTTRQ